MLSLQTGAAIAKAEIAEIETTSLRSKYAGKKAGAGPGGRKKLIKGKMGDWELLKQMEMEEREKDESVAERAGARLRERLVQEEVLVALPELPEQHRKRKFALLRFLLRSENSPKATTPVPDSPMPSEAIEGSDYESTPSCSTFGAAGAPVGCPGPSITRALKKRPF